MNIIVFSKNRACQLDLLLESFRGSKIEAPNKRVFYTFTSDDFKKGYLKVKAKYPEWQFDFQEKEIKDYLLGVLTSGLTMFLVDDNVFVENCRLEYKLEMLKREEKVLCISLRLGKNISHDYMADKPMVVPEISSDGLLKWKGCDACWGYPMSLDGHIFRTEDIIPLIKKIDFNSPNELEWQLSLNPINKEYMICFESPVLTNLAINKVQTWNDNRHGSVPAEFLNAQYLVGKKIDLKDIIGQKERFNSTHVEANIKLI